MSEGPYGRHGFNANAGYGGGGAQGGYGGQGGGGGYAAPSYGQGYGQAPSSGGAPPAYGYGGGGGADYGAYGAADNSYAVRALLIFSTVVGVKAVFVSRDSVLGHICTRCCA